MIYYGNNDYRDYLAHYGILGMHWGIRRYQPYSVKPRESGKSGKEIGEAAKSDKTVSFSNDLTYKQNYDVMMSHAPKNICERKEERLGFLGQKRSGSDNSEAIHLAAKTVKDLVTLNKDELVKDIDRYEDHAYGKTFVKKNLERMSALKVDSETGFKLKSDPGSIKDDLLRTNPEYTNFNKNTKHNCLSCAAAFEMRRRGYDVQANKALFGYAADVTVPDWFTNAKTEFVGDLWNSKFKDRKAFEKLGVEGKNDKLASDVETTLLKQGEGARGILCVSWDTGSGHAVNYEVKKKKVRIYDAQSSYYYPDSKDLVKHAMAAKYIRLDDLDFDKDGIKEAVS